MEAVTGEFGVLDEESSSVHVVELLAVIGELGVELEGPVLSGIVIEELSVYVMV